MRALLVLLLLSLVALTFGQQICLRDQCAKELTACGADCVALMGKCYFSCTLSSQGCLQNCIGANAPAQNLLECSFNKCINL
jgi:hypothetical protein